MPVSQFDGGRRLPEGWDVREPCPGDNNWRIVHNGTVLDGQLTEVAALHRAWAIIDRHDRERRSFGRPD